MHAQVNFETSKSIDRDKLEINSRPMPSGRARSGTSSFVRPAEANCHYEFQIDTFCTLTLRLRQREVVPDFRSTFANLFCVVFK